MKQRVVIVGAGFAGMAVARQLAQTMPETEACDIVVVDQNNFSLFTPMLTEVVGGEVDPGEIVAAIRSLAPRVSFEQGRVTAIDAGARTVTIAIGDETRNIPQVTRTLQADQLVIALGSVTNFHSIPGLREYSLTVKSVDEADIIRNRAIALLERADEETDRAARRSLLTFVVGGGGFSGVETMAALNDLVRGLVGTFPQVDPGDVRTVLVHPGERILPELSTGLATYAQRKLEARGVEMRLSTEVSGAGSDYVEVKASGSGQTERIGAHTCVWAGGVKPNPVIDSAGLKLGKHHGIVVDACGRVHGHAGVWALGDCAEMPQPDHKGTYAPTAQNAIRAGAQVARNIASSLQGGSPQPFVYHPIGELAIVGRRSGVASVYGWQVSGTVAWAMWRAIYLAKLPTLSQRVRIASHWLIDLAFGRATNVVSGGTGIKHGKADQAA
jgi:NADH:ubiquinone reductase (H+-translocating)